MCSLLLVSASLVILAQANGVDSNPQFDQANVHTIASSGPDTRAPLLVSPSVESLVESLIEMDSLHLKLGRSAATATAKAVMSTTLSDSNAQSLTMRSVRANLHGQQTPASTSASAETPAAGSDVVTSNSNILQRVRIGGTLPDPNKPTPGSIAQSVQEEHTKTLSEATTKRVSKLNVKYMAIQKQIDASESLNKQSEASLKKRDESAKKRGRESLLKMKQAHHTRIQQYRMEATASETALDKQFQEEQEKAGEAELEAARSQEKDQKRVGEETMKENWRFAREGEQKSRTTVDKASIAQHSERLEKFEEQKGQAEMTELNQKAVAQKQLVMDMRVEAQQKHIAFQSEMKDKTAAKVGEEQRKQDDIEKRTIEERTFKNKVD